MIPKKLAHRGSVSLSDSLVPWRCARLRCKVALVGVASVLPVRDPPAPQPPPQGIWDVGPAVILHIERVAYSEIWKIIT